MCPTLTHFQCLILTRRRSQYHFQNQTRRQSSMSQNSSRYRCLCQNPMSPSPCHYQNHQSLTHCLSLYYRRTPSRSQRLILSRHQNPMLQNLCHCLNLNLNLRLNLSHRRSLLC
jgi:hypothetical protein